MRAQSRAAAAVVGLLFLAPGPSRAQVSVKRPGNDPVVRCYTDQVRAVSGLARWVTSCLSRYARSPDRDPDQSRLLECRSRGHDRFVRTYDRAFVNAARRAAICELQDDAATVEAMINPPFDALYAAVMTGADPLSRNDKWLRSSLLRGIGGMARSAFSTEGRDARRPDEVRRLDGRQRARDRFLSRAQRTLDRALDRGVVYAGISFDQVVIDVDMVVDDFTLLARPIRFAIAGRVFAAESSYVDSDVNDPDADFLANDDMISAQQIPTPATVGGYVNAPLTGQDGRSWVKGDVVDLYRMVLSSGQEITLYMAEDPLIADLDMCLFIDDPANPGLPFYLDCSMGIGGLESMTAPYDGEFFVEVYPFLGASTYVLTLGQLQGAAQRQPSMRLSDDFVLGEAIVRLKPTQTTAPTAGWRAQRAARAVTMNHLRGAEDRELLFGLDRSVARPGRFRAKAGPSGDTGRWEPRMRPELKERADTIHAIKQLRRRSDVETADLNRLLYPTTVTPTDPLYARQWHYPLIHLPEAWDLSTGAANVVVAVVDTGVATDHPDLVGRLTTGYDFVSQPWMANDGDGIDADPDDPGDLAFFGRSSFHGTHVAGTVVASAFNGIGGTGVAFNSMVMPVRVLGVGGGTEYDVLQGVRYAAGMPNDSGLTPSPADIINLSLGGSGFSDTSQQLFSDVANSGVVVIAAAGNGASTGPLYPAGYDDVVSVGAIDFRKELTSYSNIGPTIDMVAPGGDASVDLNGDGLGDGVLSTLVDDSVTPRAHYYEIYEGTSMAAPHVAGVAALMKSIAPAMTHADFETLLMSGTITEDLGTAGRDDFYGWGLIDAYAAATAAINLAGGIIPPPIPILAANTGTLNFGAFRDTLPLVLSNATGGALSITSISSDQGFVTAAAQSVDVDGLGTYDITVNRSSLDDGPASATLTITSTANTLTLTVFLYEGGAFLPHSGRQYILVIDPDTQKTVARMERQGPGGVYEFQFLSLREGEYYLLAGSDQDNDGYICDSGESCGGYPTLGTLERIVLDTDLLDLEFESGFPSALNSSATATGGEVTLAPTPGPFAR